MVYLEAELSLINEYFISFAGVSVLSILFGYLLLCYRKGFLLLLFAVCEFGYFTLFVFIFQWLVMDGRLSKAKSNMFMIVQLVIGCVLLRVLIFMIELILICFGL